MNRSVLHRLAICFLVMTAILVPSSEAFSLSRSGAIVVKIPQLSSQRVVESTPSLYSQWEELSSTGVYSNRLREIDPSEEYPLSAVAYDDFYVPFRETWRITDVVAPGYWVFTHGGIPQSDSIQVTVRADNGGHPGKMLFSRSATDPSVPTLPGDQEDQLIAHLSPPLSLSTGMYWISISLNNPHNGVWAQATESQNIPIGWPAVVAYSLNSTGPEYMESPAIGDTWNNLAFRILGSVTYLRGYCGGQYQVRC